MIFRDLVCNYFERNGGFNGVEASCIGHALADLAKKNSISVEEAGYQVLGYRDKKEFENKLAIIKGDETVLEGLKSDNLKDAADELKIGKLRKLKRPAGKLKINGVRGLEFLVAEFYKNDLTNVVQGKNGYELLPFWLFNHVNSSLEKVLDNEGIKKCFVKFKTAPCRQPVILNKTLYTSFEISSSDKEAINREAFRLALHKGEGNGWFYKMPADSLIFLSENDPETYKNLLEYAAAMGKTYADLLNTKFVKIPDFLKLYENLQCIFYKFGSQIAYRKGSAWFFEEAFHFLSDTVNTLREPLDVSSFVAGGSPGTGRCVDAIHCF